MKSPAQLQVIDEEKDIFQALSRELRVIVEQNGSINYKNHDARNFFNETEPFFHSLIGDEWVKAMTFLKRMFEDGKSHEATLVHRFHGEEYRVFYRGQYASGRFYLVGQSQPREQLEEANAFMQLMKQLPCGIIRVNHQLAITDLNHQFENLVFSQNTYLLPELPIASLQSESEYGRIMYECIMETLWTRKDSTKRFVSGEDVRIVAHSVYLAGHQEVVGFIFDESAELKYESLLAYRQQMESVSHLAAGVAHELRNPLSVIRGFLQLSELTDSFHKYSHTIFSEVDRMNVIIENFLSMSRRKFERKLQAPMGVMRSVEDIIRSECLLKDVVFEAKFEETDRKILMNETMIKQVILNLLRNSIEAYSEEALNKRFNIHSDIVSNHYRIKAADNGSGIPAEILNKLGEPFTTTKDKGTGIGISLSKKLIEDHGGTFKIESEVNVGTVVTLMLPFYD